MTAVVARAAVIGERGAAFNTSVGLKACVFAVGRVGGGFFGIDFPCDKRGLMPCRIESHREAFILNDPVAEAVRVADREKRIYGSGERFR